MHGEGVYYFADTKKQYEGQFEDNKISGLGVMTFPGKHTNEGEFKNGMMNGKGTQKLVKGSKYVGEFKNDEYHGKGIFYSVKDQTKRQGEWSNGGRIAWLSQPLPCEVGDLESSKLGDGVFSKEQRDTGTLFSKSGKLYKGGTWQDDIPEDVSVM